MSRSLLVIVLFGACSSAPRTAEVRTPPPPAMASPPGAPALDPPKPALRLPRNFVPTAYRVRLAIDPAKAGFHGSIEIDGEIRERSKGLWLHGRGLTVTAAKVARGDKMLRVDVAPVGE